MKIKKLEKILKLVSLMKIFFKIFQISIPSDLKIIFL